MKYKEKKKKSMGTRLAMGAVAMAGAIGFVKGSRRWICDKYRRIRAKMKGADAES